MEEGIFRGLFQKLFEQKYNFLLSAILSSLLFGFWHVIAPLRSYYDGTISFEEMFININNISCNFYIGRLQIFNDDKTYRKSIYVYGRSFC